MNWWSMIPSSFVVIVLATVLGAVFGVVFEVCYPSVHLSDLPVTLFAYLGLLTAFVIAGVWKVVTKK